MLHAVAFAALVCEIVVPGADLTTFPCTAASVESIARSLLLLRWLLRSLAPPLPTCGVSPPAEGKWSLECPLMLASPARNYPTLLTPVRIKVV